MVDLIHPFVANVGQREATRVLKIMAAHGASEVDRNPLAVLATMKRFGLAEIYKSEPTPRHGAARYYRLTDAGRTLYGALTS